MEADQLGVWVEFIKLFASLGTLAGVIVAVINLRSSAKANQFRSFIELQNRWAETETLRRRIRYGSIASTEGSEGDRESSRAVVDTLNIIATLVEEGLVPSRYVFTLMAVEILRLTYRLEGFMESESLRVGIPYGKRVLRLRDRAARYCSIRPNLRSDIYVLNADKDTRECAFHMNYSLWSRPEKRLEIFLRNTFSLY